MRFLADESVDIPVFLFLKERGFDIEHVAHISNGLDDDRVLRLAFSGKKILLTVDKDFGDLAFKFKRPSHGIILYRLEGMTNQEKALIVDGVLRNFSSKLEGAFTVISSKQVRVKKFIL
jgi:predicted nuclease of predicted toxin-antitoxin system